MAETQQIFSVKREHGNRTGIGLGVAGLLILTSTIVLLIVKQNSDQTALNNFLIVQLVGAILITLLGAFLLYRNHRRFVSERDAISNFQQQSNIAPPSLIDKNTNDYQTLASSSLSSSSYYNNVSNNSIPPSYPPSSYPSLYPPPLPAEMSNASNGFLYPSQV